MPVERGRRLTFIEDRDALPRARPTRQFCWLPIHRDWCGGCRVCDGGRCLLPLHAAEINVLRSLRQNCAKKMMRSCAAALRTPARARTAASARRRFSATHCSCVARSSSAMTCLLRFRSWVPMPKRCTACTRWQYDTPALSTAAVHEPITAHLLPFCPCFHFLSAQLQPALDVHFRSLVKLL